MPPEYKALATPALKLPDWFFNPQFTELNQSINEQEALRARELANEINSINVEQATRKNESDRAIREQLMQQFGNQNPDEPIDSRRVSDIIARTALSQGDYSTAIAADRSRREAAGLMVLNPQQLQMYKDMGLDLPEGTTVQEARMALQLNRTNLAEGRFRDPLAMRNRQLIGDINEARLTGSLPRGLPPAQVETITEIESIGNFIDNVKERYIPEISENRAERFLAASVNPNSAAARLNGELNLLATQLAAAYNGKRLSDLDFRTMSALLKPNPLDTYETMIDRLDRIKEFMAQRRSDMLSTFGKANFNVGGFTGEQPGRRPEQIVEEVTSEAGKSTASDEAAFKEQYKAKLRAQRGR